MRPVYQGFEFASVVIALLAMSAQDYPCAIANIAIAAYMRYARVVK